VDGWRTTKCRRHAARSEVADRENMQSNMLVRDETVTGITRCPRPSKALAQALL
jgi:hypothetical protein